MNAPTSLDWLTKCPAGDTNFKGELKKADAMTIRKALTLLEGKAEKKTAIKALEMRLKRLEKEAKP